MKFETKRLRCQSLSLEEYASFENGIEPIWQGFTNPFLHLIEGPSPMKHRIPRVKANPAFADIGLVLAIDRENDVVVGSAGFHDFPDSNGMIEIGYGIVEQKQNQGYGTELLHGMWNEISKYLGVKILRYTVSPNNAKSLHIIRKIGFELVGEQIDEEDGIELIYEKSIQDYLNSNSLIFP